MAFLCIAATAFVEFRASIYVYPFAERSPLTNGGTGREICLMHIGGINRRENRLPDSEMIARANFEPEIFRKNKNMGPEMCSWKNSSDPLLLFKP